MEVILGFVLVVVTIAAVIALRLLRLVRRGARRAATSWLDRHQPHLLAVFGICFPVAVIFFGIHFGPRFLPPSHSRPADAIAPLFTATTVLTGIAFFLTQALLFYFLFRFRAKPGAVASPIAQVLKLELTWTLIPAVCFVFLYLWGQLLWTKVTAPPPPDALVVDVVAEQFNWKVHYPGQDQKLGRVMFRLLTNANTIGLDTLDPASRDDFVPVQLHIPKNRPIELRLRSKDVIHSFYIPYFRVKMDAVPGMITSLQFTALQSTREMREQLNNPAFNYEVACAELCGRLHFAMKLIVVVDEPQEYDRWSKEQKTWMSRQSETSWNQ